MLGVLWLILRILLLLILAAFLLLMLVLCVRCGVEAVGVSGETGGVSVDVRLGPLHIPLYPPPRHMKKTPPKQAAPSKEKKKKKRKPPKYRYVFNREALDIGELADLAMTLLSELADTLRISKLRIRLLLGTADAATTGLLLGALSAFTGMLVPFFENTFDMKDYHVTVDADFNATHTEWAFTVFCSMQPIRLLIVMLHHLRDFYRLYKKLIRKEEAITHE